MAMRRPTMAGRMINRKTKKNPSSSRNPVFVEWKTTRVLIKDLYSSGQVWKACTPMNLRPSPSAAMRQSAEVHGIAIGSNVHEECAAADVVGVGDVGDVSGGCVGM